MPTLKEERRLAREAKQAARVAEWLKNALTLPIYYWVDTRQDTPAYFERMAIEAQVEARRRKREGHHRFSH